MAPLRSGRLNRVWPLPPLYTWQHVRSVDMLHTDQLCFEASSGVPVPAASQLQGLDSQDVTPRGSASAWQGAGGPSGSFTAEYGNGSSGLYSGGSGPLHQGNGQLVSGRGSGSSRCSTKGHPPAALQARLCLTSRCLSGHVSVLTRGNTALQEQGGTGGPSGHGAMRGAGAGGGLLHGYGSGSSMSEAAAAASPGGVLSVRWTWQFWCGATARTTTPLNSISIGKRMTTACCSIRLRACSRRPRTLQARWRSSGPQP